MDIKALRYFLALVQEESVTRAAEALHITQPTLSRQLADLEDQLGAPLFIRGSRKITLTEEGKHLRKRAEEILSLVLMTESEFNTPPDVISGDIYIGGGETHVMRLIADIIHDIQQESPDIRVHLYSGNADAITERIDKGLLDFGLLIEPVDVMNYDSILLPECDSWGALMRKDSPLANQKTIHPQDLWDIPLIVSSQRFIDQNLANWLQRDYRSLNIVATYNLIFNATLLVEKGIGYALCLEHLVNTEGEKNELCFRTFTPKLEVNTHIIWKKQQFFSKPAMMFLQKLKKQFECEDI